MKMDYLSEFKKAHSKNVTLDTELSFDIANILYKVVRI